MLVARNWERELVGGETKPQVFVCSDQQEWVLKLPNPNHFGVAGICADWIGTSLAAQAEVPVLECNLVVVDENALWTVPDGSSWRAWAQQGIAFASLYESGATDVFGLKTILDHATAVDLARIVVTDTWLDVLDRKKDQLWNLLLCSRGESDRLVVIDYGMALTDVMGPPTIGARGTNWPPLKMRCPTEWMAHLSQAALAEAVGKVEAISNDVIDSVFDSVPAHWRAAEPRCDLARQYLIDRRSELAACFGVGGP